MPIILGMMSLGQLGKSISDARREQGLRQIDLATKSGLSRATIDALENGRAADIGVSKLSRPELKQLSLQEAERGQGAPGSWQVGAADRPDGVGWCWLAAVAQEVGVGVDLLLAPCLVCEGGEAAGENLRHAGCPADRCDDSP